MAQAPRFPNHQPSLAGRFLDLLLKKFAGTMKHLILHMVILAAAVVYDFLSLGRGAFVDHFWEAVVPIVWVFCGMVIFHSFQAAAGLIAFVRKETATDTGDTESMIFTANATKFRIPTEAQTPPRFLRVRVWGITSALIGFSIFLSFVVWLLARQPKEVPTPAPSVAVFVECTMEGLPLTIPAGESSLHIVAINKKRMQSQSWGFFEVLQSPWPEKQKLDKSAKNLGVFGYKCVVGNHSAVTVQYLAVPIDMTFGNEGYKPKPTRYSAIVPVLDPGKTFTFHMFNDCNKSASGIWQQKTTGLVLGENKRREITLQRMFTNPVDQIMLWFPNTVRFANEQPCAEQ
jgi:hypothetical protein